MRSRKRTPTESDLTRSQRRIYEALPEDLRQEFLRNLPMVSVPGAAGRRKAQQLRERAVLVEQVVQELDRYREHLTQVAKDLEQGSVAPDSVDLRQELSPPVIQGVAVRFVRPKKG